jgi:glycosyltransferase involved in cell wall biosynthesis
LKVLFDNQIFIYQDIGGISNYFVNLIDSFESDIECKLPQMFSENIYLKQIGHTARHPFDKLKFRGKKRIYKYLSACNNNTLIKQGNYDIFHPTYYNCNFINLLPPQKPFVITVHDMIHEKFPIYFNKNRDEYKNKYHLCQKAHKIIAVSNQTKLDIMDIFSIPENKIEVIYHGTNFTPIQNNLHKINWLPKRYLLYVGTRSGYKNFSWMISAIANILKETEINLVIIGNTLSNSEYQQIKELGIANFVITGNIFTKEELQEVYNRAEIFIFPSLYEGFGIPILEAFASNVPILLSNTSCFPEIAKDAASYFEVNNELDFKEKIMQLLNSESLKKSLISAGQKRLEKFTWKNAATSTAKVYHEVLNE